MEHSKDDLKSFSHTSLETLWEWHITSDTLFLSRGACLLLGFTQANAPATMTAFLAHIQPSYLPALHEQREGVLNGTTGSFLETIYPVDALLIHERLFVLERNTEGRATLALGQYVPSTLSQPSASQEELAARIIGYWHCNLQRRTVHLDAQCLRLLGYDAVASRTIGIKDWKNRIHPDETVTTNRHRFILKKKLLGDTLNDKIRILHEDGTYVPMLLRGAILERNAQGKALSLSGSLQKVDAEKNAQQQETGRLLFAVNATGDGLWDWDAQTDTVYYSPRYLSMVGYTAEQFPGTLAFWKTKIHPDDHDKIVEPQRAIVESPRYGDTFECTYRLKRADGTWAWILGRGYVTHRDSNGKATRIVGMHTDVTTLQHGREELEALVKNDALTGLRSRTYCDMEMERLEKNRIRPLSIVSCDVCGLKLINDYLGHALGDKLLNKAAMMLRHSLRATDCVARTGGDEFVILLPGCGEAKAQSVLEKIEQHFEEYNMSSDMPVLISFGIASTECSDVSVSKVLIDADRNMIRKKQLLRKAAHRRIKDWIERKTQQSVSLEDDRYEC